jgi:flagellar biosynthetic protein FlhB
VSDQPDESEKTEEPTAKKLGDARAKGSVAKSQEINHFFGILSLLVFIAMYLPWFGVDFINISKKYIELTHQYNINEVGTGNTLLGILIDVARLMILPVASFIFFAIISGTIQNGLIFTTEPLKPDINKINPINGLKNILSLKSFLEVIKGIFKIAIVGSVAAVLFIPAFSAVEAYMAMSLIDVLMATWEMAVTMITGILIAMVAIALLDLTYQRYDFNKQMRMTRKEVKDEHKNAEGDPAVKARIRQIRMERAKQRMMANVPEADVVVTNPTHYAVALKYAPEEMEAPKVVAKGIDAVAERIRDVAKEHKVPVLRNPPLARALYASCDIDDFVPKQQFKAVAEIISYVFQLKGRKLRG